MNTTVVVLLVIVGFIVFVLLILPIVSVCTVKTQKARLVLRRKTDRIVQVVIGPGKVWRTPILEKSIELDLAQESVEVPVARIITQDLLAIEATLLIVYTRAPKNVSRKSLEALLPNYGDLGETIKVKADYIIRKLSLSSNQAISLVTEAGRSMFEMKLRMGLEDLQKELAFRLDAVQVLVAPNEQILNARLKAEGARQSIGLLSGYMGVSNFNLQNLLTAELITRINCGEVDLLAAMSLLQNTQMSSSTQISPGVFLIDAPSPV